MIFSSISNLAPGDVISASHWAMDIIGNGAASADIWRAP
jgi:hypothetical protein